MGEREGMCEDKQVGQRSVRDEQVGKRGGRDERLLPLRFYPFSFILNVQRLSQKLNSTHREMFNKLS